MSGKTITRADLCEAIYRKFGLSRTECVRLLELVLKEVTDCLERGETVKLSSFGSFVVRRKGQRMARNPKTNVPVPISPRRVMVSSPRRPSSCGSISVRNGGIDIGNSAQEKRKVETSDPSPYPARLGFGSRAFRLYCGPVLRHAAEPTQAANCRSSSAS